MATISKIFQNTDKYSIAFLRKVLASPMTNYEEMEIEKIGRRMTSHTCRISSQNNVNTQIARMNSLIAGRSCVRNSCEMLSVFESFSSPPADGIGRGGHVSN